MLGADMEDDDEDTPQTTENVHQLCTSIGENLITKEFYAGQNKKKTITEPCSWGI